MASIIRVGVIADTHIPRKAPRIPDADAPRGDGDVPAEGREEAEQQREVSGALYPNDGTARATTVVGMTPYHHPILEDHMAFHTEIFEQALRNDAFRREVVTGQYSQVVLMSIPAGQDIGEEVHDVDQTLIFVAGEGEAILGGEHSRVAPNMLFFVPAGTRHNFINDGTGALKLFTIYAPPEHAAGTVHKTKAEAEAAEAGHR